MAMVSPFTQVGIFPGDNVQVTHTKANEPRSECSIAVDPRHPNRLLGASKHFTDPAKYVFSLGAVFSDDWGATWQDLKAFSPPADHDIYTDPSAAFDAQGNCWVMGDPGFFRAQHPQLFQTLNCPAGGGDPDGDIRTTQMLAFKSTDSGAHWSAPTEIVKQRCTGDDKGWIACDNATARAPFMKPGGKPHYKSPYHGRMYAVWGAATPFRFARSNDGTTWTGQLGQAAGADVCNGCYAPDLSIGANGWLHVFWHNPRSNTIQYLRSKDGGDSFEGASMSNGQPVPYTAVTGLTDIDIGIATKLDGWTVFDGATFRVLTIVSACCFGAAGVIVAWADARDGHSRIYYRVSYDNGDTWEGDPSGTPMLPGLAGDSHQFHPQLAATHSGVVGCAMYSYSKTARAGKPGVDVLMACSFDTAVTFDFAVVTDHPWDPALHAPVSHGVGGATFIGDYFGLDASANDFHVLWTDTRTGTQDLFYCQVATSKSNRPNLGEIYGTVTPGVPVDGGGLIFVNGHPIPVPPWDPMVQILNALASIQTVSRMNLGNTARARAALYDLVIDVAQLAKAQLGAEQG